jgi:hypothetical protein
MTSDEARCYSTALKTYDDRPARKISSVFKRLVAITELKKQDLVNYDVVTRLGA